MLFRSQGSTNNRNTSKISFSDFIAATESGNVSEVNINGSNVTGFLNDGRSFSTYVPNYPNLVDKLNESGVKITAEPSERSMHPLLSVLLSWFPMLLLIGVWIFFMRQMQGGGGGREGSDDAYGEDDFVFSINKDEFLDILFEDFDRGADAFRVSPMPCGGTHA